MIRSPNPKGTALPVFGPRQHRTTSTVPFGRLEGSLLEAGMGTCLAVAAFAAGYWLEWKLPKATWFPSFVQYLAQSTQ